MSREQWPEHRKVPNVVRDTGLAYRDTDNNGREVYCPVCLKYRRGVGHEVIKVYASLCASPKKERKKSLTRRASKGHRVLSGYATL